MKRWFEVLWLIVRRELGVYLRSPLGFVVMATVLLLDGLLFNVYALGGTEMRSSTVLALFFYFSSGTTMAASLFIAMRAMAEERQTGSAPLLLTAPVRESQIVLGKFLGGWLFLGIVTASTVYMPLLVFVNGTVTAGQIAAGYLGLALLGSACMAIGSLGSALAPNQTLAVLLSAAMMVLLIACWWIGRVSSPPMSEVAAFVGLYHKHMPPFMHGVVSSSHVAYYLLVTYTFLQGSIHVLEARRWR